MRDGAWKEARAASQYEEWELSLHMEGKAPSTVQNYAYTVRDLLRAHPEKEPHDFTEADCKKLLREYPAAGRVTREAHLDSFFRFLHQRRVITTNPMQFVEVRKASRGRPPDEFSDSEVEALCGLDYPDGPLFRLMFECGLKKGECRRLRRSDIDLRRGDLIVRRSRSGTHERVVELTALAEQAVRELDKRGGLRSDDYLWYTRPGGTKERLQRQFAPGQDGIGDTTFANWYRRCIKKAGVLYRSPETTRRTFERRSTAHGPAALFERQRIYVDRRLRDLAPEALIQLTSACRRRAEGDAEARSQALTSCRRALKSLADAVYPATNQVVVGADGKERKMTDPNFISRLLQFVHERDTGTAGSLLAAQVPELATKLDALNALESKGVHAAVSEVEVDHAVLQTYMTVADIVRVAEFGPH